MTLSMMIIDTDDTPNLSITLKKGARLSEPNRAKSLNLEPMTIDSQIPKSTINAYSVETFCMQR